MTGERHQRLRRLAAQSSLVGFAANLTAREREDVTTFSGSVRKFWQAARGSGDVDDLEFWRREAIRRQLRSRRPNAEPPKPGLLARWLFGA